MTRLPDGPVAARDAAEDEEDAEVEQPQAPRLFLAFSTSEEKPMFSKVDRTLGKDAAPLRRKMCLVLTGTPISISISISRSLVYSVLFCSSLFNSRLFDSSLFSFILL